MENNERDRKLEQWLDEALSEYSAAEPRLGLEQRVLNRVRGEENSRLLCDGHRNRGRRILRYVLLRHRSRHDEARRRAVPGVEHLLTLPVESLVGLGT